MKSIAAGGAACVAMVGTSGAHAAEAGADSTLRGRVEFSANAALVSDYRARGITNSDGELAVQGGVDLAHDSGWSTGVWASSVKDLGGADAEVDLYVSRTFALGETELSIGATAFLYPGADEDADYGEALVTISRVIGPVDADLSVNYAWEQSNLADEDNLYVTVTGAAPLGRWRDVPFSLGFSAGYEEGAFAVEETKADWSLSLSADVRGPPSACPMSIQISRTPWGTLPGSSPFQGLSSVGLFLAPAASSGA
jgi:uncharacterized protein (TIGR02001 family)